MRCRVAYSCTVAVDQGRTQLYVGSGSVGSRSDCRVLCDMCRVYRQ